MGGYQAGREGLNGSTVPAFTCTDIRIARIAFNMGGPPRDLAYHPCLNLVAGCSDREVRVFDRQTGNIIPDKFDMQGLKMTGVFRTYFSAGENTCL